MKTALLARHPFRAGLLLGFVLVFGVWGIKLTQLHHSVGESERFWADPRGEQGGLRYVALGDSAAQGIGASRPDNGYVGLIAERLRRVTGRPVEVINLSRSGARIDDLLREQLPELLRLDADVVTVAIGGNDVRAYDAMSFARQVERLAAALPAGSYVADVPYFMHGRWERDAAQAARTMRTSVERHGLTSVPLHRALRDRGFAAMVTEFAADWFHPNDRGHRVWANAFWAEMQKDPALRPHRARRRPGNVHCV